MTDSRQSSKGLRVVLKNPPAEPFEVEVLGVTFQAFIHPATKQPVFSLAGSARGLQMPESSTRDVLKSESFKTIRGNVYQPTKLQTTVSPNPISVVTMADLNALVQVAAQKGNPVAIAMSNASFPVILQQSVDEALGIIREPQEYLKNGTELRRAIEAKVNEESNLGQILKEQNEKINELSKNISCISAVAQQYMTLKDTTIAHHPGLSDIMDMMLHPSYQKALPSSDKISIAQFLQMKKIVLSRKALHCFANTVAFSKRPLSYCEAIKQGRVNVYSWADIPILEAALKSTLEKFPQG